MGLTLDELAENDEKIDIDKAGFSIVIDPGVKETITLYGGLLLDYVNDAFGQGLVLTLRGAGKCA